MAVVDQAAGIRPFRNAGITWASYLALPALFCLLVFTGTRHEPWADETQAWLLARDNSLPNLMIHALPYEGSPGLWHAFLWGLERLGYPFRGLWLASSVFALAGASLLLGKAPFPLWMRIGCIFSYFFAYQYAIVARSYALDLLLFPLLAIFFEERVSRPIRYCLALGICANANAYSWIVSSVLFCEFLYAVWHAQKRQARPIAFGCSIFLVLALAAVLQAWPPSDISFNQDPQPYRWCRLFLQIAYPFIDRVDILNFTPPTLMSRFEGFLLTIIFLAPSLYLFRRAGVLAVFIGIVVLHGLFALAECAHAWHSGIIYLAWIFSLWVSWPAVDTLPQPKRTLLLASIVALLVLQIGGTAAASVRDIVAPYSAGPAAAAELATYRQLYPDAAIGGMGYKTFSLQPWFPANIFANYNDGAPKPAYYEWRRTDRFLTKPDLATWIGMTSSKKYDVLVLATYRIPDLDRYVLAAQTQGYCKKIFPGGMIYKTYVIESDDLILFERGGAGCLAK